MKKTLTNILIGTSLVSSLLFNSSCDYKKTSEKQIQTTKQISQEDTLLETARNSYFKGDYNSAKENYSKFLEIKKNKNDRLGIAKGFNNLGVIFNAQGNYDQAIEYNLNALKIYENLNDSLKIAQTSGNIGIVFDAQKNYEKALRYYNKTLEIEKNLKDSLGISRTLNNIGVIFEKQDNNEIALKYYFNSLEIASKINNKEQEARCYNDIAVICNKKGELNKSFENYEKSLKINQELEDKEGIALSLTNLGEIYRKKRNYSQTLKNLNNALEIAQEIGAPDLLKDIYLTFSETYEAKNQSDSALKYYKKFTEIKDTLLNSESLKQVAEIETKYQSEKKEQENNLLRKDNEVQEAKNEKQKYGLFGLAGILGLSGFLAYSMYRGRKKEKKAKEKEMGAKKIIEEKNKEITDSINYAKNIQTSILPRDEEFKRLLPESFVLYKPKDIVSGDFYWLAEKFNKIYFAACDSTGHGVPGAFMSVLNSRLLNEALNGKQIEKPNEIFNYARQNIIESLKSTSKAGEQKDGMDSVLCAWDKKENALEFSCANNPLYLIRNKELIEYKPDKMPIGYSDNLNPFTLKNIKLEKNDLIYILSDGYKDQFGGESVDRKFGEGKKFGRKNLKELLLSINEKSMNEQKDILDREFLKWKGSREQVDDVLIIGVRV